MIFITAIISMGIGLALGGFFWGHYADSEERQAEEIAALQSDNLRLRGQAAELATLAHEAQDRLIDYLGDLSAEISRHSITKRKLSAAKGQITKLRRRLR